MGDAISGVSTNSVSLYNAKKNEKVGSEKKSENSSIFSAGSLSKMDELQAINPSKYDIEDFNRELDRVSTSDIFQIGKFVEKYRLGDNSYHKILQHGDNLKELTSIEYAEEDGSKQDTPKWV